jgi:hypothetical protein
MSAMANGVVDDHPPMLYTEEQLFPYKDGATAAEIFDNPQVLSSLLLFSLEFYSFFFRTIMAIPIMTLLCFRDTFISNTTKLV